MAKCTRCGKKGLFLKLDEFGHCEECQQQIAATQRYTPPELVPEQDPEPQSPPDIIFLEAVDDCICAYLYDKMPVRLADTSKMKIGSIVTLEAEPDNEYDENAIMIKDFDDKLGYVPKGFLQGMISDYQKKDWPIEVKIDSINGDEATFAIAFYKPIDTFKSISSTLVKTSKKDFLGYPRSENLDLISEGDVLHLDYSYDSDTYIVTDETGNELGELPKTLSDKMYEEGEDYKAICEELTVDDNLKTKCKVKILLPHSSKLA